MKRSAVFCVTLFLAAEALVAGGFLRSVEEAQKQAQSKNQLIFVDLFAEWCGWCHRFERDVVPSEKFQETTKDKVLLRVDIEDGKEGTKLAREYGITNLPTFLLLTPEMMVAGVIRGYAPAEPFSQELIRVEKDFREFEKRVANERAISKDHSKRLELARDFYRRHGFSQAETRLRNLLAERSVKSEVRDEAYYLLALVQTGQLKYDQATATLQKLFAFKTKTEAVEQARYLLGHIYIDQKNYQAALVEFKRFKSMYPSSPLVKNVEFLIPQLETAVSRAQ